MFNKKSLADQVATAGVCLLVIAAVDGAIKLFEYFTSITLWLTCGLIGLALLGGVQVVVGAFEKNSGLRRGLRRIRIWNRRRLRRRASEALGSAAATAR
jgi:hypothetical protein